MAIDKGARRVRDGAGHRRLSPRLRAVGAHGRAARRGRGPRHEARGAVEQARREAACAARGRLVADARDAGQAVHARGLAVRAQVRRLSAARREARRPRDAPLARGQRPHGDVPRRRGDRRGAAVRALHHRRRGHRQRSARDPELRVAPEARPAHAPSGRRARGARAAEHVLRVRPARVRRSRPALAAARGAQGRAALAAADDRAAALFRARRRARRGDVRRGGAARPRRRRRQARGVAVR